MTLCNPVWRSARTHGRKLSFVLGFAAALLALAPWSALPAQAQNNSVFALRDTESEELLKSYEMPLARAAGLDVNSVNTYVMGDLSVNAFATQPEDIFVFAGILLWVKSPSELIGVMAHETGHLSAGHSTRIGGAMSKAMIPMLLSLVVGIAVMVAGGGEAGMAIMGIGQSIAMGQLMQFSRIQESAADQIAAKLLLATHQSPMGLYHTFQRFAQEEAMASGQMDPFAADHPVGQDRVSALQDMVDASPYKDVPDPPQSVRALQMVQAKLAGFILPVNEALRRYPVSDTSAPARYARAMAYLRKPDLQRALAEINSLIKDEPDNPYFYEVLGQIHVMMAKPLLGIPAYQTAVRLKPNAPQLRAALATAQLATDDPALAPAALTNLKAALLRESEDPFTWYEIAHAYSLMKNQPMADLATAESNYNGGNFRQALVFASRARRGLPQGSADWQRANDIIGAAPAQAAQQEHLSFMQNMLTTLVTAVCGALIAVAAVVVLTNAGYMPLNETQLRGYLMSHPQLVSEMSDAAQRAEDARSAAANDAAIKKVGVDAFFNPRLAYVTGPVNAPNTMVEFYDYDCPYCRASLPAVKAVYDKHKADTRFAFIEFPLDIHGPGAVLAARASLAARAQPEKFLAFHTMMMGESDQLTDAMVMADAKKAGLDIKRLQADMANPEIAKIVADSHAFGKKVGLVGTPTFIINGVMYPGALDEDAMTAAFKKT